MAGNGNPRSLANLRPPYKKGESGNLRGRKKQDISRVDWQEFAAESAGVDKNGAQLPSREIMVMRATFKCATDTRRKDCTAAQRIFYERVQGRVPEHVAVAIASSAGANPIETLLNGMIARKASEQKAAEEQETGEAPDESTGAEESPKE